MKITEYEYRIRYRYGYENMRNMRYRDKDIRYKEYRI
jgi:hypothetical protein